MKKIIKNNRLYFLLVFVFLLAGVILLSILKQGDAILFFSDHRSVFGDAFFRNFTKMGEEIIYLLSIAVLLFYRFRYALLVPFMGLLVTIISFSAKAYFIHPRPSVFFRDTLDQVNLVDGVHLLSGLTSFPSGHTMSGFAMYGLLALMLPRKQNWAILLLFLMALGVGISRMYLVQHFSKDVFVGAFTGTLLALLVYYFQSLIPYRANRFLDKGLWGIIKGKRKAVERV